MWPTTGYERIHIRCIQAESPCIHRCRRLAKGCRTPYRRGSSHGALLQSTWLWNDRMNGDTSKIAADVLVESEPMVPIRQCWIATPCQWGFSLLLRYAHNDRWCDSQSFNCSSMPETVGRTRLQARLSKLPLWAKTSMVVKWTCQHRHQLSWLSVRQKVPWAKMATVMHVLIEGSLQLDSVRAQFATTLNVVRFNTAYPIWVQLSPCLWAQMDDRECTLLATLILLMCLLTSWCTRLVYP